jgi:hypothetical protein
METWRTVNPGRDSRLWDEHHNDRGRKFVWLVLVPLLIGLLAAAALWMPNSPLR